MRRSFRGAPKGTTKQYANEPINSPYLLRYPPIRIESEGVKQTQSPWANDEFARAKPWGKALSQNGRRLSSFGAVEIQASSDLERLKAAVRAQLERMVRFNPTRADDLEKFQELIDAYNSGSRNIEEIFKDLVALTGVLTEEQGRHVREHLSEEELTIFDILTRPGPTLTTEERDEVKKVARQLLERLNALLVLGWRQKAQARAGVRLAIEDGLDEGLPRAYTKETYQTKCDALFEHVYESYMGDGKSSYTEAA